MGHKEVNAALERMASGHPPIDIIKDMMTTDAATDARPSDAVSDALMIAACAIGISSEDTGRFAVLGALAWLAFNEGRKS